MSNPKVIKFPQKTEPPTVEIQPHPEEVIDVDPEIISVMKARLAGESLSHFFSRDDQVTKELDLERERQKLKAVFTNASDVFEGFSSLEAIKTTRIKLREHRVNTDLLFQYARRKLAGQPVDEADLYAHLVTGCELRPKQARAEALKKLTPTLGTKARRVVEHVASHYLANETAAFGVSKEMIELSPTLRELLKGGEIQGAVNEVLNVLYGEAK